MMAISVKWRENKHRTAGPVNLIGSLEVRGVRAWTACMQVVKHPAGWTVHGLEHHELFEYSSEVGLDQVLIRTAGAVARKAARRGNMALARCLRAFARAKGGEV